MNPLCNCGCGGEVSLPWNKWIQGHHNTRQLTEGQRKTVQDMIDRGDSTYKIAALVGRSQACIQMWKFSGVPAIRPAEKVLRIEDLQQLNLERKEYWSWRKGKKLLRQMKSHLRNPSRYPLPNGE